MVSSQKIIIQISPSKFEEIEREFRKNFNFPLETIDLKGRTVGSHCSGGYQPQYCKLLGKDRSSHNRCIQDRIRSLHMAFETGQPYTTICHAGVIVCCVPLMNHDVALGGIVCVRGLPETYNQTLREDIEKRLIGLKYDPNSLFKAVQELPVYNTRQIHDAAEYLYIMLYDRTNLDPHVIQWRRQQTTQQAKIGESIHDHKLAGINEKYPFQSEQELIAKVRIGDKTGAREILNSLLGSIMFRNPGQLNISKIRLVELLGILSRSASEAGVDPDILLGKNAEYINKVLTLESQTEICSWISLALNDFIESVYEQLHIQNNTRLRPTLEYLQKNYQNRISIDDIAKASHMSVSRLCHLFKEQLGLTVFDYLTNLRVSRAKYLLVSTDMTCLEICLDSGFNNLSYFNRTFKKRIGMTPSQFRKQNIR